MGGNGNRIEMSAKIRMAMRYWTGNGNEVGMGMIPRKWERMGTTIIVPAHRPFLGPAITRCSAIAERPRCRVH